MPIQGGKAIANVDLGIQGDDTGENMSEKNPHYCELTVLYWAWKNLKGVDYIGLDHYRRYFKFSRRSDKNIKDFFLTGKDIDFKLNRHLGKYDIILAKPSLCTHPLSTDYSIYHYSDDYRLFKKTIKDLFPDYFSSFCDIMEYNNKISRFNMFITRWEIFDDYCKWLFPILEELEKVIDISRYSVYQARVLAFMAERLLNIYVLEKKLKVKYYPVLFLGDDSSGLSVIKYFIYYMKCEISFLFSIPWKGYFKKRTGRK
jgi:hypothetical protein